MTNGKYVRKRRLRWRKEFVLLCSIAILLIGMVGGSLAYLFMGTDPVTNTFIPADIDVEVTETMNDEKTVKSNVYFKNTGDIPVYMRAKLIINWTDADGNIVPAIPEAVAGEYTYTKEGLPGEGWSEEIGGYYYYESAVNEKTKNLVDSITANYPPDPEYFLYVDVLVETVQAEPVDAVIAVWGEAAAEVVGAIVKEVK